MGIPDHLTCLLRILYAGQEATVRTRHGTTDWFQIGKGICQGCILSPCLFNLYAEFSSVQSLSHVRLFATPWTTARQASIHHQLPESTQTHVQWVGDAIQPSHPLSSPSPPALNLSQHQSLFQWVNYLHEVAKYWSFSFSINPSNEYPGLISFKMDWLDLLAAKGLSRLFSNTTVQKHQFFSVQISL